MSGKRYPEEFKIEAVKQVVDRGYSVASVATRLDITTHSLYAWIKNYGPDSSTNQHLLLVCSPALSGAGCTSQWFLRLASAAAFTTPSGRPETDRTD